MLAPWFSSEVCLNVSFLFLGGNSPRFLQLRSYLVCSEFGELLVTSGEKGMDLTSFGLACFVSPCWGVLGEGAYVSWKNKLKKKSWNDAV